MIRFPPKTHANYRKTMLQNDVPTSQREAVRMILTVAGE